MNKTKFTPGNWYAEKNEIHDRMELKSDERENWIGSINLEEYKTDISLDEAKANAALISAAPEMFEALEKALNEIESSEFTISRQYVGIEIRKALAKAKGDST